MSKYNLYLTKRPNISITLGNKLVGFTLTDLGAYGYSTDCKQEIAFLDEVVEAGGVIYVDENVRTIDNKIEFTRKGPAKLGSVKVGAASTTPPQEGTKPVMAQEEVTKVNLAPGQSASLTDLGQAVDIKKEAEQPQTSLAEKLAQSKK